MEVLDKMRITRSQLRRLIREQLEDEQERSEEQKVKDVFSASPRQGAELATMVGLEVAKPMNTIIQMADEAFSTIEELSAAVIPPDIPKEWGPGIPSFEKWINNLGLNKGWLLQDSSYYNKTIDLIDEIYPLDEDGPEEWSSTSKDFTRAFNLVSQIMRDILWGYAGDNFQNRVNNGVESIKKKEGRVYRQYFSKLDRLVNG
jgi:hypothetical protein